MADNEHVSKKNPRTRRMGVVLIIILTFAALQHGSDYFLYRQVMNLTEPETAHLSMRTSPGAVVQASAEILGADRQLVYELITHHLSPESRREPGVYDVTYEAAFLFDNDRSFGFRLDFNEEMSFLHAKVTNSNLTLLSFAGHIPDEDGTIRATLMEVLGRHRDEGGES